MNVLSFFPLLSFFSPGYAWKSPGSCLSRWASNMTCTWGWSGPPSPRSLKYRLALERIPLHGLSFHGVIRLHKAQDILNLVTKSLMCHLLFVMMACPSICYFAYLYNIFFIYRYECKANISTFKIIGKYVEN